MEESNAMVKCIQRSSCAQSIQVLTACMECMMWHTQFPVQSTKVCYHVIKLHLVLYPRVGQPENPPMAMNWKHNRELRALVILCLLDRYAFKWCYALKWKLLTKKENQYMLPSCMAFARHTTMEVITRHVHLENESLFYITYCWWLVKCMTSLVYYHHHDATMCSFPSWEPCL